jgi:glycerol uptake facilitator-like aquaporin
MNELRATSLRPPLYEPGSGAAIRCFHEHDPSVPLRRRALIEAVGTLLLVFVVSASGMNAQHLAPSLPLLSVLANAIATAGALVALILALGPVSGGHFNPLITALQWLRRERSFRCTFAYCAAQFAGAALGAVLANVLFTQDPTSAGSVTTPVTVLVASEVLASAVLMIIVFACARAGLQRVGPISVGAWLTAAIIAMPSGSMANPAIAAAGLIAIGPMALTKLHAISYMLAECAGALVALAVISVAYPHRGRWHRSYG